MELAAVLRNSEIILALPLLKRTSLIQSRCEVFPADLCDVFSRSFSDPSGLLNDKSFFSDAADDESPHGGRSGSRADHRGATPRSQPAKTNPPLLSSRVPPKAAASSDIAPWMSDESQSLDTHGFASSGLFGDGLFKSEAPFAPRPGTGQTADSDSPDMVSRGDDRRPSMTSATTVSSQNSWSKASAQKSGHSKKIPPFLSDLGRTSSKTSEISIPSTLQREQTRSSHHNSINTSYTDDSPQSPGGSRPLTPLPSSEVTPWLFQDFKVSQASFNPFWVRNSLENGHIHTTYPFVSPHCLVIHIE